jgi:peptide/nickel transport system ATP-binding protein
MCDRVLVMQNGAFVDELTRANLQAGRTQSDHARSLYEASYI